MKAVHLNPGNIVLPHNSQQVGSSKTFSRLLSFSLFWCTFMAHVIIYVSKIFYEEPSSWRHISFETCLFQATWKMTSQKRQNNHDVPFIFSALSGKNNFRSLFFWITFFGHPALIDKNIRYNIKKIKLFFLTKSFN